MATADCTKCGKSFNWRATRGARLANIESPCCHAPAKAHRSGDYNRGLAGRLRVLSHVVLQDWLTKEFTRPCRKQLIRTIRGYQIGNRWYATFQPTDRFYPTTIDHAKYRYFIRNDDSSEMILVREEDYQRLIVK